MSFYTSDERRRMAAALKRSDAAVHAYRMRERIAAAVVIACTVATLIILFRSI